MSHKDFFCLTQEHHAADPPTEVISSLPQPQSFASLNSTTRLLIPQVRPAVWPQCSHSPVTPFPFPTPPFPPSLPPVPPRLPNGTIPIPPPGWIPPPAHHTGIIIPPPPIPPRPSIPPPPTFLGPPPPLMVLPSVPPPAHTFPLPMQPGGPLDKGNPSRQGSAPLSVPRPPWPAPPFPRFNPFVPPPDYPLERENPHKVTVEKALEVIMDELKLIIKKDITRRMIEGIAFKAFEDWWERQEKKTKVSLLYYFIKWSMKSFCHFNGNTLVHLSELVGSLLFLFYCFKIQVSPLKSGAPSVEERSKLINPLSHISGQGKKPPLPSFKVKQSAYCYMKLTSF